MKRAHLFISSILMAAAIAVPATAQEQEETTLAPVVVTATRTEVPVTELGVSATVITADEIQRRHITDVSQLLQNVVGLNISQTGSRGGTTVLYPRGGENNFTLIMIDGVHVNLAGGDYDFSNLTTDNIERIEIIRGPQSALYGSDAMGGVINIITKRGQGKPTIRLSTANGAHHEGGRYIGEQKIGVSGGNERIGYSFAYGRIDDKGILNVNNDYYNNTFSGRLDVYPSEIWEINLTARYADSKYEFPTELGGDRVDKSFPGLDPDQYQRDRDTVIGVQTRNNMLPWWENVFQLGFHRSDKTYDDPPNKQTALDAPPGSHSESSETRATIDYHLNLRFARGEALKSVFTAGYAYDREALDLDSLATIVFGPPPFGSFPSTETADKSRHNNAFYLQEQLGLFNRLFLTGGVRVDDNSEYGSKTSPRGSVALDIRETGTKLRAAVGTGIKEPTFLENFGGFGAIGNPKLDPEKTFSWEVGVDQTLLNNKVALSFTYFNSKFKDLIAAVYEAPIFTFENIQKAEAWGLEFTFLAKPGPGLTLGGNYTYLNTEVTDDGGLTNLAFAKGKKLLRRPKHSASFFVNWLWRQFNVNIRGTYVGDRDDLLFQALDTSPFYTFTTKRLQNNDYFTLDAAASYTTQIRQGPVQQLKFFVKGQNVFDNHYQEVIGYSSPEFSAMGGVEILL
ncbi:MAG: TonB-dependent receptor [Deltaproteobacteria bacterium]|nr:TonB-dependent receptor [Deltaproteobacteria bacterium]